LESGSTLEELLTKQVFKECKVKNAGKGVAKAFLDKISNIILNK